jgi:hypothetical protein
MTGLRASTGRSCGDPGAGRAGRGLHRRDGRADVLAVVMRYALGAPFAFTEELAGLMMVSARLPGHALRAGQPRPYPGGAGA